MSPEAIAQSSSHLPGTPRSWFDRIAARVFSFPAFLAIALVTLATLTVRSRFNDPDLWWHLKTGEAIWNNGSIPRVELFSYTTGGHSWIAHEWLSDFLLYGTYRWAGYAGLMLLLCALVSIFCVLVYLLGWLACGNPKVALLGGLIGWLFGTVVFALRPQMFGYVFLIVELLLLHLGRRHHRGWLWGLLPMFALWVNCHSSQVMGLMVLTAWVLSSLLNFRAGSLVGVAMDRSERRMFTAILPLSVIMLLVNPIGPSLPLYPFNLLLHQTNTLAYISEWRPVDLSDPRGLAMFGVAGLIFLLVLVRRSELRLNELAMLVLGMAFAIRHNRMLVVFGILAAPVVCRLMADMWEGYVPERDSRKGNLLVMALAITVIVWSIPGARNIENQIAAANPVRAVEFIRNTGLSGPMLNDFTWGGYLMWALPEEKVFIDGRSDVYDWTGVFMEYGRWALVEEDPRRLLDKYHVKFCLLSSSAPMANVLPYVPGWREVYRDELSVIFARI